jgi:hypothetical protein
MTTIASQILKTIQRKRPLHTIGRVPIPADRFRDVRSVNRHR